MNDKVVKNKLVQSPIALIVWDAIESSLDSKERFEIYQIIRNYTIYHREPEDDTVLGNLAWRILKPLLDSHILTMLEEIDKHFTPTEE